MTRRTATLAALLALLAIGCDGAPKPKPGPVLVLDVKFEQPDELASVLGATLLFDGTEIARFRQPRPEVAVVFSKTVQGVAAGEHEVAVRIDEQAVSPTVYVSGGYATYAMKQHPLVETGGPLETGQAYRWKVKL
jgi:hypothetical protein